MIELMLQAERNLAMGLVDQAERLYRQVLERDPRNAIAVVGLARVAIAREDDRGAYALAVDALRIDPQNAAAIRLEGRLAELFEERGDSFEREPFAVRISAADSERAGEHLRAAARSAPPPAPGKPDYAPTPGTRFADEVSQAAGPSPSVPAPTMPETAPSAAARAAPASAEKPKREEPAPVTSQQRDQTPAPETEPAPQEEAETPAPSLLKRLFGRGRSDK